MNPTVRGLLIVLAIAGVITVLSLEPTLQALFWIVRIAFLLAITFWLYLLWRDRRSEIAAWGGRQRVVFYGGALLMIADIGCAFVPSLDFPSNGLETLVFIAVLVASGFAMWRVWRDEHTYSW
jgi:hypothetical protein